MGGGDDGPEGHQEDHASDQEEPPSLPNKREEGHGLSKAVRERLAQADTEIEELERKLGIKKGRKSLPKAFKYDGLADLVGHLEGDVSDSENDTRKRRRDYDDWLSSKRRKTASALHDTGIQGKLRGGEYSDSVLDDDGNDTGDGGSACGLDEAVIDEDIFRGLESDAADSSPEPRQKENPYVAPATGAVVAKYVPPSLRRASGMEDEARSRLRKQVQGQVNRLIDANILSIVQSIDDIYQKSARGDVTELLTDAIMAQVCRPESLPDQFFVLMGGFSAAIYKIIGSSFGSHLVRRVVKDFGAEYDKAGDEASDRSGVRKAASNTIAFLTQLYVFEVVGCKIVFDYMARLLENLSEINVELLLRVCRMTGRLLRRDDPQALKHVSAVLSKAVSKLGHGNVSARTKFMIETIDDLKNTKPKAKGMDSAVVSEYVLRMKKRLGELKSRSRRLDGLAAMGMGLDVKDADTRGRWWLVGASVPAYRESSERAKGVARKGDEGAGAGTADDEDMDFVLPDYPKKARAQGLGTTAQIAIFAALMSANGHEHGFRQYADLRLKKDELLEIARVLVQCVGSETRYNEYYALVGRLACTNGRVRFALQDRLWKILRGLGESLFGEEAEDEETAESERMKDGRRARNVARFYASLVGSGALSISILKPLELPKVNERTSSFVEWFMISLLRECSRGQGPNEDASVEKVFGPARQVPSLAAGTHWFLRKRVRKTRLVRAREDKRLDRLKEKAQAVVQAVAVDAG